MRYNIGLIHLSHRNVPLKDNRDCQGPLGHLEQPELQEFRVPSVPQAPPVSVELMEWHLVHGDGNNAFGHLPLHGITETVGKCMHVGIFSGY